jgi:hypothetical protein
MDAMHTGHSLWGAPVIMTVRWILSGGLDLRNINSQVTPPFRICQGYPPSV